ncbi:MAG TPA: cadmium resistance protein CadD, partial [Paenibacillaceae bacterium]|nr:cadmium resistance protein CadD [Paenibacillaceae bacterium]
RLWVLGDGDEDDEEEDKEVLKKSSRFNSLMVSVALIAIAGGGEELAIYIPYFAALSTTELIITLITFNLLVPIWCTICRKIASLKHIQEPIEKYERILVPIVFIGLGLFVFIESNTISAIMGLFK